MSKRFLVTSVVAVFVLAACAAPAASTPTPSPMPMTVHAMEVWGRPSSSMATVGAFYMILHNTTMEADRLLSASSTACGTVEIHETVADASGMMTMQPVDGIDVPANAEVELKPGGYHIMCIGKQAEFVIGAKLKLTLTFEKAGAIEVTADIRDE